MSVLLDMWYCDEQELLLLTSINFNPSMDKHIEAETKWPTFRRQHFQMNFLESKYVNFDWYFTEVCF